ncbi:hypothetical protein EON65_10235 [archaeon]|nr:MAG: hypothetical protein EON65_10235 [archaeon]
MIAKDLAAKYKAQQREEVHLKKFAAFAHAKQEVEHWMEMGIIDKYKVALNLVQSELTKHNINPINVNLPNGPSNPSSPKHFGRVQYVPAPKAADIQILRLQPVEQGAKAKEADQPQLSESKSEQAAEQLATVNQTTIQEGK